MKKPLWNFIDTQGTFVSETAHRIHTLYFPLCNNYPILSSLSPDLHGDLKTGFNSFLLEPVSRVNLSNLKSSRNFWIYINPKKIWSATGVSKDFSTAARDTCTLEAGLLWHTITRSNTQMGLEAKITSFIPATGEPVELMYVEIKNISTHAIKFTPTAAIPMFARSASNLHDHRHVTSLLTRIKIEKSGVVVTPTLSFDETGHKKNSTSYFVMGIDEKSSCPCAIYPTQEEFTGEAGDFEAPEAILENRLPDSARNPQGREPMGGLKFAPKTLAPKKSYAYIILMGITTDKAVIGSLVKKFNTPHKVLASLNNTKAYWQKKSGENSTNTGDTTFDNWLRWVNVQPVFRKKFGCSFLPDFDYGKGGRGWRDLWQDCLSLILNYPSEVRELLINNFSGVRIDGSNATIIGSKPGEFIADRNNIPRVWMDHGIWPLITTHLYLHQTRDIRILKEETSYFRDAQLCRGKEKDWDWKPEYGKNLITQNSEIYKGTILEHLLIQNLVPFFNVGSHNHILLEGADWNDGLDMAGEYGESVAFTALYAQNLTSLCEILETMGEENVTILKESLVLLDSLSPSPADYDDINQKHQLLSRYFHAVKSEVSGEKIDIPVARLINDLEKKAEWISWHLRKTEWLDTGFFNGYYDNNKDRAEGKIGSLTRITLTGQVFPVMSGIATNEQVKTLFKNCKKYLQDREVGGFRLNTDFKQEQYALGRAFSFIYGDKENGAFFNHMAVMFAYALYKRGFAQEGYTVIDSIYQMAKNTEKSKIYPCLPEYFNAQGRGMYSYLTGSASWFMLTLLTQVFGVRGEYGDLMLEPKLTGAQFKQKDTISLTTSFAERKIEVRFINKRKKDYGRYSILKITVNGKAIADNIKQSHYRIKRAEFLTLAVKPITTIEVVLD
jgi:cellobiose phosphorylase